jgi:pimeloyl-ACP methyl ester carboxylesterase
MAPCKNLTAISLAIAITAIADGAARAATPPQLGLHLTPCTQGQSKAPADCGTYGVYENRATRTGRVIDLAVIVLRAKHETHQAVAVIAGGPGESATPFAGYILDGYFGKELMALRDRYDLLFVDDRGMGASNPFSCDFAPAGDPKSYFLKLWPDQLLSGCRAKIAATHDPSFYNTNNTVDDLNDVRAALGYPRIVLDGGSYGTFFSLVYMRRHPSSVESVILDGVSAPHFQPLPGSPDGAQQAMDELIAACKHDATCHANFPAFPQQFNAVLQRLDKSTLPVSVMNPATKRTETVQLSKAVFVDAIRHTLYAPQGAAYLPYVIDRADRRDYAPLGQMIATVTQGINQGLDLGANLSYSCADWMPFIDPKQVADAAVNSFAGDLRIRAQQHACSVWNVPPMPSSFNDPVHSSLPVLMISSSNDPGTPPRYGEAALRYLPNAREVLVKGGGHAADTPCTERLIVEFVRAGSAKGLDVAQCTATFAMPPFAKSMKGWPSP